MPDDPNLVPVYNPPPTWTPQFAAPGLSVRATFLATDGSRPQELIVEWGTDPGSAALDMILNKIHEIASGTEVRYEVDRPATRAQQWEHVVRSRRTEGPFSGVDTPPYFGQPAEQVMCMAEGPGHLTRDGHWCCLEPGHQPVEEDGRAHRCGCGGLFATDSEVPDVPGRAERDRRHREGR